MEYPTKQQVVDADRVQICRWHRFLPDPKNYEQGEIICEIYRRFVDLGGFTPEISKQIGW